jgi:methionyl-tRNA synthetase
VAGLALLSEPFLPFTSNKLKKMLRLKEACTELDSGSHTESKWNMTVMKSALLPPGHTIGQVSLLFTKIDDAQIEAQLEKLQASKVAKTESTMVETQKTNISFDDFSKMDLRIGTITSAQKMPKTKKLLILQIDIGSEVRTIVSGIAEFYKPDSLVGQKVSVVCNLKPRTLRGVKSQGMVLMAKANNGQLVFVQPDATQRTQSGMVIK